MENLSEEDLLKKIDDLEKQNIFLQSKNRYYESPSPARAYYVAQKVLNQQVDYLAKFDLETEIKASPKEDKVYDRAIAIFEKMSDNANRINNLKRELDLTGDEKKDTSIKDRRPFTPEMAADQVGQLAGQNL